MTLALVSAALTPEALAALEADFGWKVVASAGPALLAAEDVDPLEVGALVVGSELVDRQVLDRFPALNVIGCVRGEPANVDLEEATRRGVAVVRSPGRNAESVADLVLGLALSVVRHIAPTHHLVVARQLTEKRDAPRQRKDVLWRSADPAAPRPYDLYKGPELVTLVIGLLGFGAIGRRVGAKAVALGMRVLAYDPNLSSAELVAAGAEPVAFDELFRRSDIVSLHAPPSGAGLSSASGSWPS